MIDSYQKILVPLDGSSLAEEALPYARVLAARFGSEITLLNVRLPAEDPYHPALKSYLEKAVAKLQETGGEKLRINTVIWSTNKLIRHPAEGIADYAEKENINLVVMASHGHSGIRHWALGGVSDKVLHISNIPVLLVRADRNEHYTFSKILIPLDGSELAECILPYITEIANIYDSSDVAFLHVVEPFFHPVPGESDDGGHVYTEKDVREIEHRNLSAADQYLEQIKERTGLRPAVVHHEVLAGNVAETIIGYSKSNAMDLIIISTHGHSGMSRWTLGSITERVLHYSDLPVLLVRTRECAIERP